MRSLPLTVAARPSPHPSPARISRHILPPDGAPKRLRAPRPERGLPPTAFRLYRQVFPGGRDQARVLASDPHLHLLALASRGREEVARPGLTRLGRPCEAHPRTIEQVAPIEQAESLTRADAQVFHRTLTRAGYPAQRDPPETKGDTRARRIGKCLSPEEQRAVATDQAKPRMYGCRGRTGTSPTPACPASGRTPHSPQAHPKVRNPDRTFWKQRPASPRRPAWAWTSPACSRAVIPPPERDSHRRRRPPHVVGEAIREGVSFCAMPPAAEDHLAGVRPRLPWMTRAQAIVAAYSYLDKPYDFDLPTEAALVRPEPV